MVLFFLEPLVNVSVRVNVVVKRTLTARDKKVSISQIFTPSSRYSQNDNAHLNHIKIVQSVIVLERENNISF